MFSFITALVVLHMIFNVEGGCPDYWTTFEGSCYYLFQDRKGWAQAKNACETQHAHLVDIGSKEENSFIEGLARLNQVEQADVWIGANDILGEGFYIWAGSNDKVTFTDWYPGEPNSLPNEDCVELTVDFNYQWNDLPCNIENHYVCERSSDGDFLG